ncbi:MAG: GatB/YqeY domain-containing protein [bacterium]
MSLKEQVKNELNQAIKNKEELRSSVLRMLIAALANKEKEKRYKLSQNVPSEQLEKESQLTEEEIMEAISYEAKKRKEAIVGFEKGGRTASAEKEKKELEILQKYLPEQLSEEEIKKIVAETIKAVGAETVRDIGKVMKELSLKTKGRADGGLVSKVVRDLLG